MASGKRRMLPGRKEVGSTWGRVEAPGGYVVYDLPRDRKEGSALTGSSETELEKRVVVPREKKRKQWKMGTQTSRETLDERETRSLFRVTAAGHFFERLTAGSHLRRLHRKKIKKSRDIGRNNNV